MHACFYTITLQRHFELMKVYVALKRNHWLIFQHFFKIFGHLSFGSVPSVEILWKIQIELDK